uniref:Kinesin motor domain-containing protein n=1 Tax=Heterorhabditis bacteriophora TaxID=37862 RepID=A0A1I7W7M5_HETBA
MLTLAPRIPTSAGGTRRDSVKANGIVISKNMERTEYNPVEATVFNNYFD